MDLSKEVAIILIGCGFFLMVAVGIVILILIYQKRQLRFIHEKAELRNQFQQELMMARLEARDETLNKISKELHDNIGQLLSSSLVLIGVAKRTLSEKSEPLQLAGEGLTSAIQELRSLSKSLNSEWLEKFNFIENLNNEVLRLNASKEFKLTVSHPEIISLSPDRQLMLFRIVQEAIQNSIKHSGSEHINVRAMQSEKELGVTIEDDGKGFDATSESVGLGMTNMRNRATVMGGAVFWKSSDRGTSVSIQLPITVK
jgi:Signal transduction histidine kinase